MIRLINSVLKSFGLQINRVESLAAEKRYYEGIIKGVKELYRSRHDIGKIVFNDKIAALAFSKDRPLQLHALLSSYFKLVANAVPIDIIYKASTKEIEGFYQELALEFSSYPIRLIKEQNFYDQVMQWLENTDADRIYFLTDDAIFLDKIDMNDCIRFNPINEIFSFRHGYDLDYSFAYNCIEALPEIEKKVYCDDLIFYRWRWESEPDSPDWNYPLSVDGHIFSRKEMHLMCKNITFNSPNSLEANLQVFLEFYVCRYGIMYHKVKMVNVPCNLVQTEISNRSTGHFSANELLFMWEQRKRINTDDFFNLSAKEAIYKKYSFYSL
jgi:hypothetical protein